MAVVIEDDQFRARDNFGGVKCMDDFDHAVASPVQDSYRALDGSDIEGDPARAVSQTIVGVALIVAWACRRDAWWWCGMAEAEAGADEVAANRELWTQANSEYADEHAYRAWAAPLPCSSRYARTVPGTLRPG